MPYRNPEVQRQYQREWLRRRRFEFFRNQICDICGSTDRLELDHKDPKNKVNHRIWSWSEVRRLAEIAKCQVLCHRCHENKSNGEKALGENHGNCKLTPAQVQEIRFLHESGEHRKDIALKFGISPPNIYEIVHGRTWAHLPHSFNG